jgi:ATP-binding protein involved in chromosome partitioning
VDDRIHAATIDVKRDEGVTITFGDGHVARFGLTELRLSCPCAGCRSLRAAGEDVWPRPNSPISLRIDDAKLHGAYGLTITWNDGHATGIFPFDALRRWSEGGQAFGPDSGLPGAGGTP